MKPLSFRRINIFLHPFIENKVKIAVFQALWSSWGEELSGGEQVQRKFLRLGSIKRTTVG